MDDARDLFEWLTTGLYVATAFLCAAAAFTAYKRCARRSDHHMVVLWSLLSAALVLLAINKKLDLQTWLIDAAREVAQQQGWYDQRRIVQIVSVLILATLAISVGWWFFRLMRGRWMQHRPLGIGLAMMGLLLLLRAADIQRVGDVIGVSLSAGGIRGVIEWLALILISLDAWREAGRQP